MKPFIISVLLALACSTALGQHKLTEFKGLRLGMTRADVGQLLATTEWAKRGDPDATTIDSSLGVAVLSSDNPPDDLSSYLPDALSAVGCQKKSRHSTCSHFNYVTIDLFSDSVSKIFIGGLPTNFISELRAHTELFLIGAIELYGKPDTMHRTVASLNNRLLGQMDRNRSISIASWYDKTTRTLVTLKAYKSNDDMFRPVITIVNLRAKEEGSL